MEICKNVETKPYKVSSFVPMATIFLNSSVELICLFLRVMYLEYCSGT